MSHFFGWTFSGREFAARLRQLRRKAQLTQKQLAEQIGVIRTTVVDWENTAKPETTPKDPVLVIALCNALSTEPTFLLTGQGIQDSFSAQSTDYQNLYARYRSDPNFHVLIRLLLDLDGESVRHLSNFIESMGDFYSYDTNSGNYDAFSDV